MKTILTWACENVKSELVKALLERGADPNIPDSSGKTPLMLCFVSSGSEDDPESDISEDDPEDRSEDDDSSDDSSVDPESDDNVPPPDHLSENFDEKMIIIKSLFNYNCDIDIQDDKGLTALMYSVIHNNFQLFKLLLDKNPDLTIRDKSNIDVLCHSVHLRDKRYAALLIQRGAELDYIDGRHYDDVLRCSISFDYMIESHMFEFLIASGADVNRIDSNGDSFMMRILKEEPNFHYSATIGSLLKILLINGADINVKNKDGETALQLSRRDEWWSGMTIALIKYGEIDPKDKYVEDILLYGVRSCDFEMMRILLGKGVDANIRGENGKTLLMIACEYGDKGYWQIEDVESLHGVDKITVSITSEKHHEVIDLLLSHGADKLLRDNDGETAADKLSENFHNNLKEKVRI